MNTHTVIKELKQINIDYLEIWEKRELYIIESIKDAQETLWSF